MRPLPPFPCARGAAVVVLLLAITAAPARSTLTAADLEAALAPPASVATASGERGDTLAWRVTHEIEPLLAAPAHWRRPQIERLGIGLALVGTARVFDTRIRDSVMRSPTEDPHRYDAIRSFGQEGGLALLGGTWIVGAAAHRPEAVAIAADGFEAVILSAAVITPVLKFSIGRARPYQEEGPSSFHPFGGDLSFPSGEATEAFAIASVVAAHPAPLWVKGGAWALAGAVGWARLHADAHWASDVVAGALIGSSVGQWVVHRRAPRDTGEPQVDLVPLVAPRGGGAELLLRF